VDMLVAYHCSILPKSMEAQQCTGRHFHNAEWWWSYAAAAIRIATV